MGFSSFHSAITRYITAFPNRFVKENIPVLVYVRPCPIIISKADIDCNRLPQCGRLPHKIVDSFHQLRRPRKRICPCISHLHNKDFTFISHTPIHTLRYRPISRRNSEHCRSMSTDISGWNKAPAFGFPKCKRLINFFFRIFRSFCVAFRRISGYALIPQI